MAQLSENQLFHSGLCFIKSNFKKKFRFRSSFICYNKHILMNSNSFQHNTIDFDGHSIKIWFQSLDYGVHLFFFISVSDIFIFRMKDTFQLDGFCSASSKIQYTFKKISSKLWKFIKILMLKCLQTVLLKIKASIIMLVR